MATERSGEKNARVFTWLREDGPFAVSNIGRRSVMVRSHDIAALISARELIGSITGLPSFGDLDSTLQNEAWRGKRRPEANRKIAAAYALEADKDRRRTEHVSLYFQAADSFINSLRLGPLEPIAQRIEMTEEVKASNDTLDLLAIMFDSSFSPRARFEAKRKLIIASLAASVDQRSRQFEEQDRYPEFTRFLKTHIWAEGDPRFLTILSKHAFDDYSVIRTERVPIGEEEQVRERLKKHKPRGNYYMRLNELGHRQFLVDGEAILAYESDRPKSVESRIMKLLQKGEDDPAVAIEDVRGLMVVVNSRKDAYKFLKALVAAGKKGGSLVKVEGIQDNLIGPAYSPENKVSSHETRMLKFFVRIGGARIEIIVHTYKTYFDYQLRDEVAHGEYELRRLFDKGVFEMLFPESIYGIVAEDEKERLIEYERQFKRKGISY